MRVRTLKAIPNWLVLLSACLISFCCGAAAYKFRNSVPGIESIYAAVGLKRTPEHRPFQYPDPSSHAPVHLRGEENPRYPITFIAYGDTQEPASVEKDLLIDRIISEKPDFVIQLGDMVPYNNSRQWKLFDEADGRIIESGIPFYPVLGNHEYMENGYQYRTYGLYKGEQIDLLKHDYFSRFELLRESLWYSMSTGNTLFLFLDSNTDYSEGSLQYEWLLDRLGDRTQRFLVVSLHHPLYSKSSLPPRVNEIELRNVLESLAENEGRGPDLVLSAHVHNYERYQNRGIQYVVSGGGSSTYPTKVDRGAEDFYQGEGATYHYVKVRIHEDHLTFEMFRLDLETEDWTVADTFSTIEEAGR